MRVEDVAGASERVKVANARPDGDGRKTLERRGVGAHPGGTVIYVRSHAKGVGPKVRGDGARPAALRMKEHGARRVLEIANPFFRAAVLVMGSYAAK